MARTRKTASRAPQRTAAKQTDRAILRGRAGQRGRVTLFGRTSARLPRYPRDPEFDAFGMFRSHGYRYLRVGRDKDKSGNLFNIFNRINRSGQVVKAGIYKEIAPRPSVLLHNTHYPVSRAQWRRGR